MPAHAAISEAAEAPPTGATARSPAEAAAVLRALTELPGHALWSDDLDLVPTPGMEFERLSGYWQVTDAHLLTLPYATMAGS